eukprot:m.223374 g.223374  ORF g.223374 m.223374 type:complete len:123 (-) comp33401_c0_seq5:398-766(-)
MSSTESLTASPSSSHDLTIHGRTSIIATTSTNDHPLTTRTASPTVSSTITPTKLTDDDLESSSAYAPTVTPTTTTHISPRLPQHTRDRRCSSFVSQARHSEVEYHSRAGVDVAIDLIEAIFE